MRYTLLEWDAFVYCTVFCYRSSQDINMILIYSIWSNFTEHIFAKYYDATFLDITFVLELIDLPFNQFPSDLHPQPRLCNR